MIKWKCVRSHDRLHFEVGKVYEEGEGRSLVDGQYTWQANGCGSAVEWLRRHFTGIVFEEVKTMQYNVGDKVRIVSAWGPDCCQNVEGKMDHWLGQVMTIRECAGSGYRMEEDQDENDDGGWYWSDDMIAGPAEELFTLHNGDVVTMRSGKRYIVMFGYGLHNEDVLLNVTGIGFLRIESYDDELRFRDGQIEWDIVRVDRSSVLGRFAWGDYPITTTVFERKNVISMEEALRILEEKFGTKVSIKED